MGNKAGLESYSLQFKCKFELFICCTNSVQIDLENENVCCQNEENGNKQTVMSVSLPS